MNKHVKTLQFHHFFDLVIKIYINVNGNLFMNQFLCLKYIIHENVACTMNVEFVCMRSRFDANDLYFEVRGRKGSKKSCQAFARILH